MEKSLKSFIFLFINIMYFSNCEAQLYSNEIHYSNPGTDINERIEIVGPAGTNLSGWSVVLYEGSNGTTYGNAINLNGTLPTNCTIAGKALGVVVIDVLGATGFAFGNAGGGFSDGWALVNNGVVKELFSYGGVFTAVAGPANGQTSVNIGIVESGTNTGTGSLQRNSATTWVEGLSTNTFGACNTTQYYPNNPLPINLISFTGKATEKGNELTWKTSNEKNFSHFEIHRSTDAQKFEKIGQLAGTSSENYQFVDNQVKGINYYRLKMVDLDGKYNNSKIISIENISEKAIVGNFYPNPSHGKTFIEINTLESDNWSITTFDLIGKKVNYETKFLQKGTNKITFDKLSQGLNFVRFDNGKISEIRKVIKNL